MKQIKPTVKETELEASTKNFKDGESAKALLVYTDDHSDLKAAGTYGDSRSFLEGRDYIIPQLHRSLEAKVKGEKASFKWGIEWNKFKKPLSEPGKADFSADGVSSKDCEIYAVLRAECRFLDEGYVKLPSKYDSVHGIDGVFQKGDEYLIVESKFVTPAKYKKYCTGKSPLPHLGWKKDEKATLDPENDPDVEVYMRQMSMKWVRSSFVEMQFNGRDRVTQNSGESLRDVEGNKIIRMLNVFGARPVYPPPGTYGFKVRVSEKTDRSQDVAEMKSSDTSLEIDWHPAWLISGQPYGEQEFWIISEDKTHIYAKRESDDDDAQRKTKSGKNKRRK